MRCWMKKKVSFLLLCNKKGEGESFEKRGKDLRRDRKVGLEGGKRNAGVASR